jgi:hypothetical protein
MTPCGRGSKEWRADADVPATFDRANLGVARNPDVIASPCRGVAIQSCRRSNACIGSPRRYTPRDDDGETILGPEPPEFADP